MPDKLSKAQGHGMTSTSATEQVSDEQDVWNRYGRQKHKNAKLGKVRDVVEVTLSKTTAAHCYSLCLMACLTSYPKDKVVS